MIEFAIQLKSGTERDALALVVGYGKAFTGHRFVYSSGIKVPRKGFNAAKPGRQLRALLDAVEEACKSILGEGSPLNNQSLKARVQLFQERVRWVDNELHVLNGSKIERHVIADSVDRSNLESKVKSEFQKAHPNPGKVIESVVSNGASELFGFWDSVLTGKVKSRSGKPLRASTIISKRQTKKIVQEFRPSAKFDSMDRKFYNDFTSWMRETKELDDNTCGRHVKELKSILRLASANELMKDDKFSYWPVVKLKNEVVALSKEDLEKIMALKLTGTIANVRDIFVIACFCGARIGDFKRFNNDNITVNAGITYIDYVAGKTGTHVRVPLNPIATKILEKHSGFPPMIAEQNFRAHLKTICKDAELNEIVNVKIRDGKVTRSPKHEAISPHSSRRTFATSLYFGWYGKPMPASLVMRYTGHSSESSFLLYIGASESDKDKQALEYFDFTPQLKVS